MVKQSPLENQSTVNDCEKRSVARLPLMHFVCGSTRLHCQVDSGRSECRCRWKAQLGGSKTRLVTDLRGAQVLAEERHDVVLKAICYRARMCAAVNLEIIGDTVLIENVVQLGSTGFQPVLVTHINRNRPILTQI